MTDSFKNFARSLTSPPENAAAIVPSDGADLAELTRALYVGGGGDVALRMAGGELVTLANLPAGTLIPLRVARVLASGTTATALVGLW